MRHFKLHSTDCKAKEVNTFAKRIGNITTNCGANGRHCERATMRTGDNANGRQCERATLRTGNTGNCRETDWRQICYTDVAIFTQLRATALRLRLFRFIMSHWVRKFGCAFRGVAAGMAGQTSFLVHVPATMLVAILAVALRCSALQCCILAICVGAGLDCGANE